MKNQRFNIILTILLLGTTTTWAQDRKISVHLISESNNNEILLRWAPKDYKSWKWSMKSGWVVERACLSDTADDGALRYTRVAKKITVQPKTDWKQLANTSQNAAIAAQLIFGESFEISTDASVDLIMTKHKEEQMRYSFAMTTADKTFKVAKLMGLGFTDRPSEECQTIIYRVFALTDSITTADTAYSVVNRKDPDRKIRLYNINHSVNDSSVLLYWPKVPFRQHYSFYHVSRSFDNKHFELITKEPYISLDNQGFSDKYYHYVNKLDFATDKVFYRLRGITPFGTTGPWSDTIALDLPDPVTTPSYLWYEETGRESEVMLHWEYPEKMEPFVSHFEILLAHKIDGVRTEVTHVQPDERSNVISVPVAESYLMVAAIANDKTTMRSVPVFVQLDDSVPPAPPTQINAQMDTAGLMTVTWKNDSVPDLFGHKIYYTHSPSAEFSQLTSSFVRDTIYQRTMDFGHLSRYVYLKFKAYDMRYNHSPFSEVIKVRLPDTIPPSEPVFFRPLVKDNGVHLKWKPSNSPDVATYSILAANKRNKKVDTLVELTVPTSHNYVYQPQKSMKCKLSLVVRDSSGNTATARSHYSVAFDAIVLHQLRPVFTVKTDYNASVIQIRWAAPENITRVKLFRSINDGPLRLYKTLPAVTGSFRDTRVIVGERYQYRLQWQTPTRVNSKMSEAQTIKF